MGRPRGSSNKPKTNGNGAAHTNGGTLTDDEKRALTLHHKRLYEAADALVERAKDDRKAVADQAKADLGKGALADIKDMMACADDKKVKAQIERHMRLATWMGVPIGFQVDMFADRRPIEDKWADEGKTAGMSGENCQPPHSLPPHSLPPSGQQIWIEAWHGGQAILAAAFGKKKADVPAPVEPADTTVVPFAAPETTADAVA